MAQVDMFSLAAGVMALLLAAGLMIAYAVNRRLVAFPWWAGAFLLLAVWLATSTLRIGMPAPWIKWLSWGCFYAAACLVAYGLRRNGDMVASFRARAIAGAILFVTISSALTVLQAAPHYWLLLSPIPVLVFMTVSTVLVFRAGAWGYGLTMLAGMAAITIRSLFHPGGLARLMNPPPPPAALRGSFEAGSAPAGAIALDTRPPASALIDFTPPPGLHPPIEHALTITLITVIALLALAVTLVLRTLLTELARMRERSTTDGMTGLLNRVAFEEAATAMLAEEHAGPVSLILFDIDHFKRVNDTAGHAAGDRVIARLGRLLRETNLVRYAAGRVGGEEFAVALASSTPATARLFAETIRAGFSTADFGDEIGWGVTVSAGIAMHRVDESLHDLTARADKALYTAKADGRDQVVMAPNPAETQHWQVADRSASA